MYCVLVRRRGSALCTSFLSELLLRLGVAFNPGIEADTDTSNNAAPPRDRKLISGHLVVHR